MSEKVRFWEERPDVQSSKRVAFLSVVGFGLVLSTAYLFITMDYGGAIALLGAHISGGVTIMAIGKKQENDLAKIENGA